MDVVYLGIFLILSPVFDGRFYSGSKPPQSILNEIGHAVDHFHAVLQFFSLRYVIHLEGEIVAYSYIVDRILCEFSASSMAFAKGIDECNVGRGIGGDGLIAFSAFKERLEGILRESLPEAFPYYSRCLERSHQHFLWTGPQLKIIRRSEDVLSIIPLVSTGELLDHPTQQIYGIDVESIVPTPPKVASQVGKRQDREESSHQAVEHPKRRKRL